MITKGTYGATAVASLTAGNRRSAFWTPVVGHLR